MSIPSTNQPLQLKIRDIKIPEGDCLERHVEIENLSPVLLNAEGPLVMGVDSPWGGGKTTFIRLWQHYLSKEGYISLCLNAWESDFTEDPLLSLVAQLDKELFSQDNYSGGKSDWEEAKKIIPGLLKTTILSVGKQLTIGGVNAGKVIDDANKHIEEASGENLIKKHSETQDSMNNFRKLLERSLSCIPDNQRNLIIFIDELDRCNPIYAVTMLERIKHLFNIEHIVFVLSINSEQLAKSFSGVYGANFDGKGYLKRFIDIDYQLRTPNIDEYIDTIFSRPDIKSYINDRQDGNNDLGRLKSTVKLAASHLNYKLRDINQLLMRVRLILRSIDVHSNLDIVILTCMLILREKNHSLYLSYVNEPSLANDVIEFLTGITPYSKDFPEKFGVVAGLIIKAAFSFSYGSEDEFSSVLQPWFEASKNMQYNNGSVNELKTLNRIAERGIGSGDYDMRKLAFERIELMHQINISE